jgi:hypothetical protein
MATFHVKFRVKHAAEITTVEAETREGAISQVINDATEGEGDEIEVLDAKMEPGTDGSAGVTGATGAATRAAGPASAGPAALGTNKATRAQLNEMSKDELVATAAQEGAEVNHSWNKDAIVEAILKHRRA